MSKFKVGDLIKDKEIEDYGLIVKYHKNSKFYDVWWIRINKLYIEHSEHYLDNGYRTVTNSRLALLIYG